MTASSIVLKAGIPPQTRSGNAMRYAAPEEEMPALEVSYRWTGSRADSLRGPGVEASEQTRLRLAARRSTRV